MNLLFIKSVQNGFLEENKKNQVEISKQFLEIHDFFRISHIFPKIYYIYFTLFVYCRPFPLKLYDKQLY
jgi:hypothetical protein